MWNFNKLGRQLEECQIQRGLVVRLSWVWPWKREVVSGGERYWVTATNSDGVVVYDNYHSSKVLYGHVIKNYVVKGHPKVVEYSDSEDPMGVHAWSFSLTDMVEKYLEKFGLDGVFLVYVPVSLKAAKNFWLDKPDQDGALDCCITDVTQYKGDVLAFAKKCNPQQPGRYLLVTIKNGFVQSTLDLT